MIDCGEYQEEQSWKFLGHSLCFDEELDFIEPDEIVQKGCTTKHSNKRRHKKLTSYKK